VNRAAVERAVTECLRDIGLPSSRERLEVLRHVLTNSDAILAVLGRIAELRAPDVSGVPDIDRLVSEELRSRFEGKVPDSLLVKRAKMGPQNVLLLALLLERVGEPVPLVELLFANDLANATSRRLRELRWEHGGYDLEVRGTGKTTAYVLRSPDPRPDVSAEYWLRRNIRNSTDLEVGERLLALLRAHLGERLSIEEFAEVNPRSSSRGKGRARDPQYATARRVRALRERGWQVYSGYDGVVEGLAPSQYVMLTFDRLPEYERLKARDWKAIMERASYRCEDCSWGAMDGSSQGRKLVEVHHTDPQHARAEDVNDFSKLRALCNVCHDAVS
jgi:hypothetical protein